MCKYYAHAFLCKHTSLSFACFCRNASLIQTPCADRDIWQTIRMEEACDDCKAWYDTSAIQSSRRQHHHSQVRRTRS